MTIDLTDEERVALDNMLTDEIAVSRYPLSPRIEMLKRVRAKLRGEEARGRLSPMRARASGIAMRCQRDRCIRKKPRRKAGLRLVRKRVASFTGRSASFERDLHAMVSFTLPKPLAGFSIRGNGQKFALTGQKAENHRVGDRIDLVAALFEHGPYRVVHRADVVNDEDVFLGGHLPQRKLGVVMRQCANGARFWLSIWRPDARQRRKLSTLRCRQHAQRKAPPRGRGESSDARS